MPLVESEIQYRHSGGGSNNNPNASLGGAMSSEQFVSNITQNLFDNVTGTQSQNGSIEYRCIYVVNTNGTLTFIGGKIWFSALTPSPDDEVDMGIGQLGVVNTGSEQLLPTEAGYQPGNLPPTGVTFTRPTSEALAIIFGDLPAGYYVPIWFRRNVNAGASAYTGNTFSWQVSGETAG